MPRWPSMTQTPLADRFWSKVDRSGGPDACWEWTAGKIPQGYGQFWVNAVGANRLAHRLAYEFLVGPVPDGLHIDHLCRNRGCVNPAHLEPVLRRVNILRGTGVTAANAAKTHCKRGHAFDAANTLVIRGYRHCRACNRAKQRVRQGSLSIRKYP